MLETNKYDTSRIVFNPQKLFDLKIVLQTLNKLSLKTLLLLLINNKHLNDLSSWIVHNFVKN